jgi:hypothetical protein
MFSRILTDVERADLERYLAKKQRPKYLRQMMYRSRVYLPKIRKDLELIEAALESYDATRVERKSYRIDKVKIA